MHASHPFTACRTPSAGAGPLSIPVHARTPVPPHCAADHGCTHFRSGPATHWVLWGDSWLFEYVLAESVSTVPASSCTPVVLASGFRVARSEPCAPAPAHHHPLPRSRHIRALLHPPCMCCVQPKHQCIASAPTEPGRSRLRALSTRAGMCRPAALTWLLHTSQVRTGDSGHRRRPFSARSPCAWRRRFNAAMHELHFFRPSSRAGGCWSLAAWPRGVAGGSQRVS